MNLPALSSSLPTPTLLGRGPMRIPTGGKIRAGIKILTKSAANHPKARAPAATSNSSTCGQVKLLHVASRIGQILSLISVGGQVSPQLP